jgi:hypothetical protein
MNMTSMAWNGISVRDFGARGDGTADESAAFESALKAGRWPVVVPSGLYRLGRSLRLPSGAHIVAHPEAFVILGDHAGVDTDTYLLTNADHRGGNEDIRVEGGIWDGNNVANPRGPDRPGSYTGVLAHFRNVRRLTLRDMTFRNSETYNVLLTEVRHFVVDTIVFQSTTIRGNQDGVHMGGGCEDGEISNLQAHGRMTPNDDVVALVADDALHRAQNLGTMCGPIRRIRVRSVFADDCHSFVRLGSVWSPIEDVDVSDIRGGCEACAVNADALRYCRVPVFDPAKPPFPDGAGLLKHIRLADFEVWKTLGLGASTVMGNPLLLLETRMLQFVIERFRRVWARDAGPQVPTLRIANTGLARVVVENLAEAVGGNLFASTAGLAPDSGGKLVFSLRPEEQVTSHAGTFTRLDVA